ncbi:hypothetical protein [Haloarcula montana]|uniref:hypothetical protein n=1 Tax=Haloarcula montana TaxID=3111776 RepID=UPI002D77878B|nr:hypothetical protein [Haloarcula sp. GH36]
MTDDIRTREIETTEVVEKTEEVEEIRCRNCNQWWKPDEVRGIEVGGETAGNLCAGCIEETLDVPLEETTTERIVREAREIEPQNLLRTALKDTVGFISSFGTYAVIAGISAGFAIEAFPTIFDSVSSLSAMLGIPQPIIILWFAVGFWIHRRDNL